MPPLLACPIQSVVFTASLIESSLGIYLGDRPLCEQEITRYISPEENPTWGEIIEFDINIKDVPRDARLCLSLHGVWANPLKVNIETRAADSSRWLLIHYGLHL